MPPARSSSPTASPWRRPACSASPTAPWSTAPAHGLEPGLSVVAAPVFDAAGTVVAALAVSGPTARLHAHRLALMGRVAIEQAHVVSERLGYRGALEDALA